MSRPADEIPKNAHVIQIGSIDHVPRQNVRRPDPRVQRLRRAVSMSVVTAKAR
jgi:hypothetical protein